MPNIPCIANFAITNACSNLVECKSKLIFAFPFTAISPPSVPVNKEFSICKIDLSKPNISNISKENNEAGDPINKFRFSFPIFETASKQFCFKIFIFKFGLGLKGSWAGFSASSSAPTSLKANLYFNVYLFHFS